MAEAEPYSDAPDARHSRLRGMWPNRWRWRISLILLLFILATFAIAWVQRERIAGDLIDDAIASYDLEASYEIESIGARQQIISNLAIGDPDAPDFTAERIVVDIDYTFGAPEVARVELVNPRLFGSHREGELSFGSLDSVIYAESDEPAGLPQLNAVIRDGRARIDSDYGAVGIKLEGEGPLNDGFKGTLAATGPGLGMEGCRAESATLYGDLTSDDGRLGFTGPARLRAGQCAGAEIAKADISVEVTFAQDFGSIDGDFALSGEQIAYSGVSLGSIGGDVRALIGLDQNGDIRLSHSVAGRKLATPFGELEQISADGTMRSGEGFAQSEWNTSIGGEGLSVRLDQIGLTDARAGSEGTLAAALLGKLERGLSQSLNGGALGGELRLRGNGDGATIIVPEARLRGRSGETVLALSRVSYASRTGRLSGNILTGGRDIPRINGRMEQAAGGDLALKLAMAEYREGQDSLTIPRLEIRQRADGQVAFLGMALADGAIPGGEMRGLRLPIEGTWSTRSGLAIGRRCTPVQFTSIEYYSLSLSERAVTLCPADGEAIATYRESFRLAAQTGDLELTGEVADTPALIRASRAVLRYPGPFSVEQLSAKIGEPDSAIRVSAAELSGSFGEEVGGSITGGTAALDIVPLDLSDIDGNWAYQDATLRLSQGAFTLTERTGPGFAAEARFNPLQARDASLTLRDNVIEASAQLRRYEGGQVVTEVAMTHDLDTGIGEADISVPGIRFTPDFQPQDLSDLAKGVIAFADGTVEGEGQVNWAGEKIESSGAFRTENFDFAAAFGPVTGVQGEIVFTDLVNLTTAPQQVLRIGSVNPGVEALDGRIVYSMTNGELITIEDGRWPFMGGELILRPLEIQYGANRGQSYIFEIVALDAATFVSQMELTNLGAVGTFDGTIPIFFDANGNGSINGGLLISRPPGGNVAYVGELTYEDLGTMGNYAFQTLRSLDYNQMSIELNGNLAGEIVTNFQIDGVRQGAGTSQNFVTRELAKLPIRFKINVRSESFFLLATIVRGLFDPTVFDREEIREMLGIDGLESVLEDTGTAPKAASEPSETTEEQRADEPTVQPPESDELP